MSVWFYQYGESDWGNLVLFDGENTYWNSDMTPSSGYSRKGKELYMNKYYRCGFTYLGEL